MLGLVSLSLRDVIELNYIIRSGGNHLFFLLISLEIVFGHETQHLFVFKSGCKDSKSKVPDYSFVSQSQMIRTLANQGMRPLANQVMRPLANQGKSLTSMRQRHR